MEDTGMAPPSLHSDPYRAMRNEMLLRGYSRKTIKSYLSWIRSLENFVFPRHPGDLNNEDIRSYLVSLIDSKELAYSTVNQAFNAIRFLYVEIYKRDFVIESIPRPKKGKILPTPLTQEEVKKLINVTVNIKHKAVLMVSYSGGLRLGEVINLSSLDIDGDRRLIFVRGGKGRKDRYTLISEAALKVLREYYRAYRPANWLFEGRKRGKKYTARSVEKIVENAVRKAGIRKQVSHHTLRHSFATHLVQNGVDILLIKDLLGHEHLKTTEIYTHISSADLMTIKNPLDMINLG
jgi:integrase/recombinase XerD